MTQANTTDDVGSRQRVPPHDIEVEACVLGSMILHAPCIDVVMQILEKDHFYRPAHQTIFQTVKNIIRDKKALDVVVLNDELYKMSMFQLIQWIHALRLEIKSGIKMSQGKGRKTSTVIKNYLSCPKGFPAGDLLQHLEDCKKNIDKQLV